MMADWQFGDLALCVHPEGQLISGAVYEVAFVFWSDDSHDGSEGLALHLVEHPIIWVNGEEWDGSDAWRFIKPANETDADDREVIALLTGKPVEVGA